MSAEPAVSVVIPAHDAERYLGAAVASALAQTAPPLEVVVIDDGSRDGTGEVARGLPVRYLRQENRGIGATRNRGVQAARGEFVAFLDADDLWAPRKLELQLQAFAADRAASLVFGHVEHFISPELDPDTAARLRCPEGSEPGYVAGAMLARRAIFHRVGPFRTDLKLGEFVDWMARARELPVREILFEEIVLRRRLHASNHTLRERAHRNDLARVVKASLDRRRAAAANR